MRTIIRRHAIPLALVVCVFFAAAFFAFHHSPAQPVYKLLPCHMSQPEEC